MNAYYSELMFRDMGNDIEIAGVMYIEDGGEIVNIDPVGTRNVSGISLNSTDIIALVRMIHPILSDRQIDEIGQILGFTEEEK